MRLYGPEIEGHNVSVAYSAYEPAFNVDGTNGFSTSPGGIDQQNRSYTGTTTDSDSYHAGIVGFQPTGLSFNLGSSLADASGAASIELRQPLLKNFWIRTNDALQSDPGAVVLNGMVR